MSFKKIADTSFNNATPYISIQIIIQKLLCNKYGKPGICASSSTVCFLY